MLHVLDVGSEGETHSVSPGCSDLVKTAPTFSWEHFRVKSLKNNQIYSKVTGKNLKYGSGSRPIFPDTIRCQ